MSAALKWRCSRRVVAYHLALLALLAVSFTQMGSEAALLIAIGILPALARTVFGIIWLSPRFPNIRKVGLGEFAYSTWFALLFALALSFRG